MIYLKELETKDVSKIYVNWMNDQIIHQFTEQKYIRHTFLDVLNFVKTKKNSKTEFLYGIFVKKNNDHIGNIKLGPININHKYADISYFIGKKKYQGKGYATKAISEIIKIAKKRGVKKIEAGVYETNIASTKALIKNKFKLEGTLVSRLILKRKRYNKLLFGLVI